MDNDLLECKCLSLAEVEAVFSSKRLCAKFQNKSDCLQSIILMCLTWSVTLYPKWTDHVNTITAKSRLAGTIHPKSSLIHLILLAQDL